MKLWELRNLIIDLENRYGSDIRVGIYGDGGPWQEFDDSAIVVTRRKTDDKLVVIINTK